LKTFRGP